MTIDRQWLSGIVALTLGRQPETTLIEEVAATLETREEVLPWLLLRQGAFADDREVLARLADLAAQTNRVSRHRPSGPVLCPDAVERHRLAELTLRDMVAQNVASSDLADTIGAILHRQNRSVSGRPGYDFRRRIAERFPEPMHEPVAEG